MFVLKNKKPDIIRNIPKCICSIALLTIINVGMMNTVFASQQFEAISFNESFFSDEQKQIIRVQKAESGNYLVSLHVRNMNLHDTLQKLTKQLNVGLSYSADFEEAGFVTKSVQNRECLTQETGLF